MSSTPDVARDGFRHLALLYGSRHERLAALTGIVRAARGRGEPVLALMPNGCGGDLRDALGGEAVGVCFADVRELGRNPARIIPAIQSFLARHPDRPACCVGEPAWPSRGAAELLESAKHEALVNLAFAGRRATIACAYDAAGLPASVLADARHTHPVVWEGGLRLPSPAYLGPGRLPPRCGAPLPEPPASARVVQYRDDLRPVRALVAQAATRAGLAASRVPDLVLAVSELAANTLRHTGGGGTLRVWQGSAAVLCQIDDQGVIAEPLAGWVRPAPGEPHGHGLWLVNQVCDLVQIRTGPDRTTVRISMDAPSAARPVWP